ncbi:TraR/DksA C4-type zinc finger protein [Salipaludibacillus agaradhaerens]|uniref:TraR/DksA C4-type zinc finger protein n=1 Tax=Salipaludibacillus agaradhaerens TaxID=76935 RepID=UPI002151C331|nr:TraR/DksA C4-type zinc finger protein [Salipaludibacillus agaradhaerens]MCR6106440.1 TraR/DksA C4-type zinc finger protein [Salipaludibacillus agaradhaerens]MCR6118473.1 TraR/DksA C4-type zinc finger protein [Salipaludibacillus agaradhaerens]UJW57574.1 TraR/DksA C4-type zinc finger protein [Bacillus sp. A116_S68]
MEDYARLKNKLEEQKKILSERLKTSDDYGLSRGFASSNSSGELSQYDNHPADSATDLYEREKDIALHEQVVLELNAIEHALSKFANGTYGICEVTGQKIPYERLEAKPTARTIIQHADNNHHFSRPAEEDVLEDFRKFNFDKAEDETQFDAEDAWQAVARFNELSMVFEDSSLDENSELIGYVEEIEGFLSTGIEGYKGEESVDFQRNTHYDHYLNDR